MQRRTFLKQSLAAATIIAAPKMARAATVDLSQVNFDANIFGANNAQTIIVFLYGAASQLSGNMSNYGEIEEKSQSDYSYFRGVTVTPNNQCWQEAGGTYMEDMLSSGDMTLFRTCFSHVREENRNKAHGLCTLQNQTGSFDTSGGGIVSNIANVLKREGKVTDQSVLPFVMLEGESAFYQEGSEPLEAYLKPVALNENLDNPYERGWQRDWRYYTPAERESNENYNDALLGFDPALQSKLDTLAQQTNRDGKIREAFNRRTELDAFIEDLKTKQTPALGADAYPLENRFAARLETAVKVVVNNPDTKIITMGADGLGGWDDHDDARGYVTRMESLFASLKSAIAHLTAEGKAGSVNIMVFGEFGRNVNLNSALGWDHGNLQNLYVLGGSNYFQHSGVVGETILEDTGQINRLFLKPKPNSYEFEPMSIASTIYSLYGITNPEVLTGGYFPISFSG